MLLCVVFIFLVVELSQFLSSPLWGRSLDIILIVMTLATLLLMDNFLLKTMMVSEKRFKKKKTQLIEVSIYPSKFKIVKVKIFKTNKNYRKSSTWAKKIANELFENKKN